MFLNRFGLDYKDQRFYISNSNSLKLPSNSGFSQLNEIYRFVESSAVRERLEDIFIS
jgi:hypothetical protein